MQCKLCNKEFVKNNSRQIYCSKKCKYEKGLKDRSKKPLIKSCGVCQKEFKPYSSIDKFCSANCRVENMKSKRSRRWGKEATEKRIGKNNPSFKSGMYARGSKRSEEGGKEYLRTRNQMRADMILNFGYLFCEHCGTNETYQWEMHHLIYRSEKPLHPHLHNQRNLINLCMKCHNWFHKNKANRNEIVEKRNLNELFGDDVLNKESKLKIEKASIADDEQHEVTPNGKIIFKHDGLQN